MMSPPCWYKFSKLCVENPEDAGEEVQPALEETKYTKSPQVPKVQSSGPSPTFRRISPWANTSVPELMDMRRFVLHQ